MSNLAFRKLLAWILLASPAVSVAAEQEVILFQPGQSSWEWLLVPSSHDGGKRMREGKNCLYCHDGEEKTIGNLIASGEKLEPAPIDGMPGFVQMKLDASYDENMLHLTLKWQSPEMSQPAGDESESTHLTVMLGTPALSVAPIAGCWAACHSDLPGMPDAQPGSTLTKYLPGSRTKMTRTGGGSDIRAEAELTSQMNEGQFLEYWQVVLDGGELITATDGYFLEARAVNEDTAITAEVKSNGSDHAVEITRPLNPSGPQRLALKEGEEYTLAIALHENHASGRHHLTSFPLRFVLGSGDAEIVASPAQ